AQPMMIFWILAVHDIEKRLLQFFGDGASAALADDAAIDFAYGRDLGGGSGKEGLVGNIEVVAGEALGKQWNAKVGGEGMDGRACNAGERRRDLGLVQRAVPDNKDVFAGAFGDEAVGVEQDGFVVAVFKRLGVGDDGVGIRAGDLGPGHGHVDVLAGIG